LAQARQGEQSAGKHRRRQSEEHPPPADGVGDPTGNRGPQHAGNHPSRRQRGEHSGSCFGAVATTNGDIGDGTKRAGPKSLKSARGNEQRHGWGETGGNQAGGKDQASDAEGAGGAVLVGSIASNGDPDQVRQHEGAERPAINGQAADLIDDSRQDCGHRQCLECRENDRQEQPGGQCAVPLLPDATICRHPIVCGARHGDPLA
jgi:hypothetical protein